MSNGEEIQGDGIDNDMNGEVDEGGSVGPSDITDQTADRNRQKLSDRKYQKTSDKNRRVRLSSAKK
jgi:hypothetical protein